MIEQRETYRQADRGREVEMIQKDEYKENVDEEEKKALIKKRKEIR